MTGGKSQVLIAIDPPLLATALAAILRAWPVEVDVCGAGVRPTGHYEIAVVNGPLPPEVTAATVLSLPDVESGSAIALLRIDSVSQPVRVSNLGDVLGMIRSAVPA